MAQSKLQNTDNPYQGSYPSVFKKIDTTDVQINPFQSYKTWTVYSSSLTSSITSLQGVYTDVNFLPALGSTLTFNDAANIDGSLQSVTYFSINHLFALRLLIHLIEIDFDRCSSYLLFLMEFYPNFSIALNYSKS
jgi:hypothetical protein